MTIAVERTPVFLLAENRLLREALTRILAKKNDLEIVGAAPHTPTTLQAIIEASPAVLLFDPLDIHSGLVFLRMLREMLPDVKVILIGMETNSELLVHAVREGVAGYMLMDATASEIVAAIRFVINGGAVCPPELCQALFSQIAAQRTILPTFEIDEQFGLTRREQQLVEMVGRGLTNKEIASELNLSEQTVKNHVHRMLRKVGVRNRLQVVATCRTRGLLPA
jgi:DNA-binding NarL/FixJ family response regulator